MRLTLLAALAVTLAAPPTAAGQGGVVLTSNRDGDDEVYAVRADGTGLVQLTRNAASDTNPVPSPDGSRIAWEHGRDLWVMDSDGSDKRRIARDAREPAWSPDGRQLAFRTFGRAFGVVVSRADGSRPRRILRSPAAQTTSDSWSPRGDRLLVLVWGRNRLVSVRPGGGGVRILAEGVQSFDWAPDGRRIAYVRWVEDTGVLFVARPDGSLARRLSPPTVAVGGGPAWSPDGQRIAFAGASRTGQGLYTMPADGVPLSRVTGMRQSMDGSPLWLPDGRGLVFASPGPSWADGARDLVAVGDRGERPRVLAAAYPYGGDNRSPRWTRASVRGPAATRPGAFEVTGATLLRTAAPVAELSADGDRVAVLIAHSPRECAHVSVWEPGLALTRIGARARCDFYYQLASPALAGDRVAYLHASGGNNTEELLTEATLAAPRPKHRASVSHDTDGAGAYLGSLRGDGSLLAFNRWSVCNRYEGQCARPDTDVDFDSTWLLGGGSGTCPALDWAGDPATDCLSVRTATSRERLVSVADDRLVLVRPDAVLVLRSDGTVVADLKPPAGSTGLSARLHGDDLVLLRRAATGAFSLDVQDLAGSRRTSFQLPPAASAGDGACDFVYCRPPALRLEDLHDGVAVYVFGRHVYLVDVTDGRQARVTVPGDGTVNAELDDAGLFYSYAVEGEHPGRVRYVPWLELDALLGRP